MADSYDVVVIGAGPGGYVAAIRAAQLGFATACVDDWTRDGGKPALGGTCTNVGCIPSKALLQSSENFEHAGHGFAQHGIDVKGLSIDVARMLARKDKVVAQNNDGIAYLFRKNKVASFHGRGSFGGKEGDRWRIAVEGPGAATISARHVIVATGSAPRALRGVAFDNERVLDNAGALAIPGVPKRLGVVGAVRHQIFEFGLEIVDEASAQLVEIDAAGTHHRRRIRVIDQRQQKVFERRILVMTLVCNRQRTMQGLFKALGKSRHSRPLWPPPSS